MSIVLFFNYNYFCLAILVSRFFNFINYSNDGCLFRVGEGEGKVIGVFFYFYYLFVGDCDYY